MVILTGLLLVVLHAAGQEAHPFAFKNVRLGMSIAEFRLKHGTGSPNHSALLANGSEQISCVKGTGGAPVTLAGEVHGPVRCDYKMSLKSDIHGVRISTLFIDGKLAVIEVEPPTHSNMCFQKPPDPGTPEYSSFAASCEPFRGLLQDITDSVATGGPIQKITDNRYQLPLFRWDNGISVAELQNQMCGPWDNSDNGWSKAISEILVGSYCSPSDKVSSMQPVILYVHKELAANLARQLGKP